MSKSFIISKFIEFIFEYNSSLNLFITSHKKERKLKNISFNEYKCEGSLE